ncbi:unnamed protein product [Citrullus colocynthis]|uniref:Uncharacterized protein n=1 Tax=Citrullus colocynthis TaxID=252529 RepID=A0ABP0Y951_9ROSI
MDGATNFEAKNFPIPPFWIRIQSPLSISLALISPKSSLKFPKKPHSNKKPPSPISTSIHYTPILQFPFNGGNNGNHRDPQRQMLHPQQSSTPPFKAHQTHLPSQPPNPTQIFPRRYRHRRSNLLNTQLRRRRLRRPTNRGSSGGRQPGSGSFAAAHPCGGLGSVQHSSAGAESD